MNNLIFCKKTSFQKIYFWMNRYVSKTNSILNLNKTNIISEDVLSAADYRLEDYNSALIKEVIIDKLLNKKILNCLGNLYKFEVSRDIFGKRLMYEIKNILLSFSYAETTAKENNITDTIYIWPLNFDYTVYRELELANKLPKNIKITKCAFLMNILRNMMKNIYFIIKSFFILEGNILSINNFDSKIKKYKYLMHMDEGLKEWGLHKSDFIIDNTTIKKNEVLFINSERNKTSWVKEYRTENFNVLDFDTIPLIINKRDFWKLYKKYIKLRLSIIYMVFNGSWIINELFYILKENFYWNIFYKKYKIDQSLSFMTATSISESLIHASMNTKTTFIYFSTTENVLDYIANPKVSQCHEYTHMYYDNLITDKLSARYLNSLQIRVKKTTFIGPILSEKIINARSHKTTLIKKYNLSNFKCIVAYTDTPAGLYTESNLSSYKDFIKSLLFLSKLNHDICYLLKTKYPISQAKRFYDIELNDLLNESLTRNNIKYVNDLNMSIYQAVGLSDFVVTGKGSSVTYEALNARQPVICYDTNKQTNRKLAYHSIDKCNAYNHDQFISLHNYWVENYSSSELDKYFKKIDDMLEMESHSPYNIQTLRDCIAS